MGLAINKNYSQNTNEIFKNLGIIEPKLKREIDFETASTKFWEKNNITIGFFDYGTLLFGDINLISNDNLLINASINKKILAYYVYEITGTYCFDLFENGKYVRKKWFSDTDENIDGSDNFGKILKPEKINNDNLETVFNVIGDILNTKFYNINIEHKFSHYKVKFGEPIFDKPESKNFFSKLIFRKNN